MLIRCVFIHHVCVHVEFCLFAEYILYTHILLKFQDMENKIRNTLNEIYFGKTKDIVNSLRSVNSLEDKAKQANLQNELFNKLKSRSQQN